MKKFILLFSLIVFLTGCSVEKINTSNIDKLVNYMSGKQLNLYNRYSKGYKYYLPKNVSLINYSDYNEQLLSNGNIYYLFVDITSYFYDKDLIIDDDDDSIYYKSFDDDNKGYIKVEEYNDNKYYIVYQYNFAKIEAIIDKKSLSETITNMSYILTSIKYNDAVIKSVFDDSSDITNSEKFELEKPQTNNEDTFLDYIEDYDKYNDETEDNSDEETINTDVNAKER